MINLALNMLIWNAEDLLQKSLLSTLPYVDEAHIIDTGSTDGTMAILEKMQHEFKFLEYEQIDVQRLGTLWSGSPKDVALTELLNKLKEKTKSDWILKVDDDEVFPEQTMKEIQNVSDENNMYCIYFYHIENNLMINPYYHRHLRVIRLFKNIPEISWQGIYEKETIAYKGKRVGTNHCKGIFNKFIHLGEFRKPSRYHDARLHSKGHCGIPIPDEYQKYVPHYS